MARKATTARTEKPRAKLGTGEIVAAIRAELERRGLTVYWLAEQLGMDPLGGGIYRMLKSNFRIDRAEQIMAVLGLSVRRARK